MSLSPNPDLVRRPEPGGRPGAQTRVMFWGALMMLWLGIFPRLEAQSNGPDEYQQKAGLICNFLRQCKWPERRFPTPDAPFIVGIFGNDQISGYLRENIQGRQIQGRSVQVRRITMKEDLSMCHLVFVSRSERDRLRVVMGETRRENILTVGESDNFLASGGVIQFTSYAGVVRYKVSLDAVRRERIEPGGFVLRMALPQSASGRPDERRVAESGNP